MDFRNKTSYSINSWVVTLIVLGILVLVNIISMHFFVRFDWTENDQYSVSDATVKILENVDDLVTVKAYFTQDLPAQFLPLRQYISDILVEYEAYGSGNFSYEFIDPADDADAAQEVRQLGIRQLEMQIQENDSFQVKQGYMGLALSYEGENEVIPAITQESLANLEYELSSLIIKLTQERQQVVAFLQGHGEHELGVVSPFGGAPQEPYAIMADALRKSYDVQTIDLAEGQTLEGIDLLVVGGPKRDLTERALFEIDQYLLAGGKAVFLIDGVEQPNDGVNVLAQVTNALSMLEPYGIRVEPNVLLDVHSDLTRFQNGPQVFLLQYPPFMRLLSRNFSEHPIVSKVQSFVVRFASSLSIQEADGLTYDRFINTSPQAWFQADSFQLNPTSLPDPVPENVGPQTVAVNVRGAFPRLSQAQNVPALERWVESGEEWKLEPVAQDENRSGREVLTEAQADGEVIVFADSDFITNSGFGNDPAPLIVFLNTVDYLTFGEELISIRSKSLGGNRIDQIGDTEKTAMKFVGIALVPLLLALFGFVRLWLRRKEEKALRL